MKRLSLCVLFVVMTSSIALAAEVASTSPDQDPAIQALEAQVREMIVEKGDYKAAMMAYAKASRANPTVTYYRDQFALIRRVMKMQKALETESNVEKWKSYAEAVRAYYYTKGFYDAALDLDTQAYSKLKDNASATQKLESQLLVKNKEAAVALSESLSADGVERLKTLRPVVLAQNGKVKDAMKAVANMKIDPSQDPTPLFDMARIYWAADMPEEAYTFMRLFLEHTIPTELATSKHMLLGCQDFQELHSKDAFVEVMATESKVAQSGCTGGSSCGSCKLRGSCSSSK